MKHSKTKQEKEIMKEREKSGIKEVRGGGDRVMEGKRERWTERWTERWRDRKMRERVREMESQKDESERQTDRQTDGETKIRESERGGETKR